MEETNVFGTVFTAVIFLICALLMIVIGISNMKSRKPCGFYSGEKGPDEDSLTDTKAWNRKHGIMWILYGSVIIASGIAGIFIGDSPLLIIPYLVGLLLPIPCMALYHHHLLKKYMRK